MKTYKNYIFDLYGTLVDIKTDENKIAVWRKLCLWYRMKGADYTPTELRNSYRTLVRKSEERLKRTWREIQIEEVFRALFANKKVYVTDQDIEEVGILFRVLSLQYVKLYDGVPELLTELRRRGKKVFLLSNAQHIFTEPEIRMLNLNQYFDGMLLSSDAGVKKPSSEFYVQLFDRYGIKPSDSVMIGNDSIADAWGAADCGIDSRYIHTEQSPEITKKGLPDNCIQVYSLNELMEELSA